MASMDLIQRVLDDHSEIKRCYENVRMKDDKESHKWFNQLIWTIARHSAAEELVMYPMLEKLGTNGKDLADKSRQDHQKVKEALSELDGQPMTVQVRQKIDVMMIELMEHIDMEEGPGGDLEVLTSGVSRGELLEAGKKFARSKMFVPTRAHPSAPDKPPFETVVGLLTAPIDKLRDVFRSFPDREEMHTP